ncbi:MAG: hypothetical protein AMXMBFR53_33450 [Gemmatimonadota bacterium]
MRHRERVLQSLEGIYREAFSAARERDDKGEMARLDLEYQREQIHLEVLLDIRDLLSAPAAEGEKASSLLEKAQALRQLTKLR